MSVTKVSWFNKKKISDYDPAQIKFASEGQLLLNLYTTLFEYNNQSEITSGVVQNFEWSEDFSTLHINIKDNLLTSSDKKYSAKDIYFSLKRVIYLQKNIHGKLQEILCPDYELKNINSDCPGLKFNNNTVTFSSPHPHKMKFLIPLLTNVDFSIIPYDSIEWNSSDLKIIDYKNTTGAYYVSKVDNIDGKHELSINERSHNFNTKSINLIQLIPTKASESYSQLKTGEIDLITTIDRATQQELISLVDTNQFSVHKTEPIKNYAVYFSPKGIKTLSPKDRLNLGLLLKKAFFETSGTKNIFTQTNELFPAFGEAGLEQQDKANLEEIMKMSALSELQNKIKLSIVDSDREMLIPVLSKVKNLEIIDFTTEPNEKVYSEQEDAYLIDSDTGFFENINLISYYLNTIDLSISKEDKSKWLRTYMQIEDKQLRLKELRKLHYTILKNADVIPIGSAPYISVGKKSLKFNIYKHFAGTPFWMIFNE